MRLLETLLLSCALAVSARAQSPAPADSSSRTQFGLIAGIAMTGLSVSDVSHDGGVVSASGNGTSPYFGLFARRSLTPSVHAAVQAVFDLKGDDGAGYTIPFLQLPVQVEYTPFAPRAAGRWVRPVLFTGVSAGVRLQPGGGAGYYASIRPFELSALLGFGVEAHFRSRDWVQLGLAAQRGLTDLQPKPGTTTSFSVAAFVKAHPGAMRRR